jgi:hypothetical protein
VPEEKRDAPRRQAAIQGMILLGTDKVWCAIHDLSATGARLEVWSGTSLPQSFDLLLVPQKLTMRATVAWREGEFAGVSFAAGAPIGGA